MLENKELDLFEEFNYNSNEDNEFKEQTITKINQTLEDNFPEKIIVKRGKQKAKNIFQFKKITQNSVVQTFDTKNDPFTSDLTKKDQKTKLSTNKEDMGIFCRSKNRLFKFEKATS